MGEENNKFTKKNIFTEILKKSSIFMIYEMVMILVITSVLFLVKISISMWHLPIITAISILLFMIFYKKDKKTINLIAVIIALIIFAGVTYIEGKVYDSTADGNTYHKLAIGCMKNGWNPCYESCLYFNEEKGNTFDVSNENVNVNWVDHYAKATEIFAAVIYGFTNNIECGKGYTLLLMYGVFGIIFTYLFEDKKRSLLTSLIIPFLLVFNAITIVQIFNYYVDGALMLSLLLLLFECIIESEKNVKHRAENFIILAFSIVLCINIKFTGVVFAALFCFAFYVFWIINGFKETKEIGLKKLKEYTVFYSIVVSISLLIVGFSSYAKNFIDHGHPLYPLYGEGHVQNMVLMEQPKSFNDKSNIEIFLISIFSKGENVSPSYSENNVQPKLKIPFAILDGEINNYSIPDIRVGGFGPLFSVVFIVSIVGTIYMIIDFIKNKKYQLLIPYLIILGIITFLLLLLDGNYWARYIPYFYAIPILVLTYLLWEKEKINAYIIGISISIIMIINAVTIFDVTLRSTYRTDKYIGKRVNDFILFCEENKDEDIEIKLNHMGLQGVLYNLDDWKIDNYVVADKIEGNKEGFMFTY